MTESTLIRGYLGNWSEFLKSDFRFGFFVKKTRPRMKFIASKIAVGYTYKIHGKTG